MTDKNNKVCPSPGMRIWYEPSPGLRFAGRVIGKGTLPDTARVVLTGHYRRWRMNDPYASGVMNCPAIAIVWLASRDTHVPEVDTDADAEFDSRSDRQ